MGCSHKFSNIMKWWYEGLSHFLSWGTLGPNTSIKLFNILMSCILLYAHCRHKCVMIQSVTLTLCKSMTNKIDICALSFEQVLYMAMAQFTILLAQKYIHHLEILVKKFWKILKTWKQNVARVSTISPTQFVQSKNKTATWCLWSRDCLVAHSTSIHVYNSLLQSAKVWLIAHSCGV